MRSYKYMSGPVSADPAEQCCGEGGADLSLRDTTVTLGSLPQSEAALQLAAALAGEHDARLIGLCIINVLKETFGILPDRIMLALSAEALEPEVMEEAAVRDGRADLAENQS
jgi:hypothetical protein